MEIQQEFFSVCDEKKDSKWEMLTARVTPDEKDAINLHCKEVFRVPYSVVTRLLWRRIISGYREIPQGHRDDVMTDIDQASSDIISYLPVILRQRRRHRRDF